MATLHIRAERSMLAPPERVYCCIADYRQHHPRFLPPAFSQFRVEQGGVGAGTEIRFQLTVGGRTYQYHGYVTEPEPGRESLGPSAAPPPMPPRRALPPAPGE